MLTGTLEGSVSRLITAPSDKLAYPAIAAPVEAETRAKDAMPGTSGCGVGIGVGVGVTGDATRPAVGADCDGVSRGATAAAPAAANSARRSKASNWTSPHRR